MNTKSLKIACWLFLCIVSLDVWAFSSNDGHVPTTPIMKPTLSNKTGIAPEFFGPNAFPVPEVLNGDRLIGCKLEIYSDNYFGTTTTAKEDFTTDIFARLTVPLFSSRVNLVLWGNMFEYYSVSPAVNSYRRVESDGYTTGRLTGDIYVSTDIAMLCQEKNWLDFILRVALKTASGGDYYFARYYDNAGYFFDATLGRRFTLPGGNSSLKLAASSGFLCWQTDNGRQNDAVMYGLRVDYNLKSFTASAEWSGYVGWERYGDAPMTFKFDTSYNWGDFGVTAGYRVGLNDWPFHQVRIGATYNFSFPFNKREGK